MATKARAAVATNKNFMVAEIECLDPQSEGKCDCWKMEEPIKYSTEGCDRNQWNMDTRG